MASRCVGAWKRGRRKKCKPTPEELEEIRDAEIRRREYKTPEQIEEESKYVYGNDVYTVSRILAKRLVRGRKEYLIKWHGYSKSQATWEPAHNILDPSVIKKFESKNSVHINVSREDVKSSESDSDESDSVSDPVSDPVSDSVSDPVSHSVSDSVPSRKLRRKRSKMGESRKRRREGRSRRRRSKRIKNSEESEGESGSHESGKEAANQSSSSRQEEAIESEGSRLTIDIEMVAKETPSGSISRDGDTSGEEIAEEPLTESDIQHWIDKGSFVKGRMESVDKESNSSRSSNFSEIQDIVLMMTERVAMEIGGEEIQTGLEIEGEIQTGLEVGEEIQTGLEIGGEEIQTGSFPCHLQAEVDGNNNQIKSGLEVSHSIDISPSEDEEEEDFDHNYQAERAQGTILGSALRSGKRVYLMSWSTGSRQVLTHAEVKEKWPQLLIKFYESNINWMKKLD